jgi:general secretion pathway protein E
MVTDVVDFLLRAAIEHGASDIHVEPLRDAVAVRFRLDGILAEMGRLPRGLAPNLVARLKVMADLLTYRFDIPQEGRIKADAWRNGLDLRLATFPTVHGEKAVVRIFDPSRRTLQLSELGFADDVTDGLRALIRQPEGMLLLTGPAGSGKTTTIYACLREIVRTSGIARQIVTIEDPVEVGLEGVTQTQVNPAAGLTFATGLRSLMRQDPQVILVGEIRDRETAHAAVEAGLTGHLLISTIHAGTAVGVFARLIEMGIEPSLITSVVQSVLAQRLVRLLCSACQRPTETGGFEPVGCEACAGLGYRGRSAIGEMLTVGPALRRAVVARADLTGLGEAARQTGYRTLAEDGLRLVRSGRTALDELRRVLPGQVEAE